MSRDTERGGSTAVSGSNKRMVVTGGAGFIGRWLVAELLEQGHHVVALDDCSSGDPANLEGLTDHPGFGGLIVGDIEDRAQIEALFTDPVDVCYHLAAKINVQQSIDDPASVVYNDIVGTFNVLEAARRQYFAQANSDERPKEFAVPCRSDAATASPKVVFVSTCMVYAPSESGAGIDETHPVRARSPYAACKLSGEQLALSYFHAYGMSVSVLRPFNTFGPYQRTDMEGGVVAVFLERAIRGEPLQVRGDGRQTRDLLYVKDCARFIAAAGLSPVADGTILNAGSGRDVSVNELAEIISAGRSPIEHVRHDHPQAEIPKLLCNNDKANRLLGWTPRHSFDDALAETEAWVRRRDREPALAL